MRQPFVNTDELLLPPVVAVEAGGHVVGVHRDPRGNLWLVEAGTSPLWNEHLNAMALVWRTVPGVEPRWWIVAGVSSHLPDAVERVRIAVPAAQVEFETAAAHPSWMAALPPCAADMPFELSFHLGNGEVWDRVFGSPGGLRSWVSPSMDTGGWVQYAPMGTST